MPQVANIQMQMQALDMKPTDLWDFLRLPSGFVDVWFLVKAAIAEYQESLIPDG